MSVEYLLESLLPPTIRAVQTTRTEGVSQGAYAGFNLGQHVQDNKTCVDINRQTLLGAMPGCDQLHWLEQVHGTSVHSVSGLLQEPVMADASVTSVPAQACVIMTADCLPVLFWSHDGSEVAAAHAGWRGLLTGVLENSLKAMTSPNQHISAWLGPAIGPKAFEVGNEVRLAFIEQDARSAAGFTAGKEGKWLADLHLLACQRLELQGIQSIHRDPRCTYLEPETFYSYRREGVTGRMASAIWLLAKS